MQQLHLAISMTTLILVLIFLLQLDDINQHDKQLNNAVQTAIKTMEI